MILFLPNVHILEWVNLDTQTTKKKALGKPHYLDFEHSSLALQCLGFATAEENWLLAFL